MNSEFIPTETEEFVMDTRPTGVNEASAIPDGVAPCPNCGVLMVAIRGSKSAICGNCGFKDSCCY
jgi:hypothetical protein